MINKDRENFQYKGGDLIYIISPLTSQLRTNSYCGLQNSGSP